MDKNKAEEYKIMGKMISLAVIIPFIMELGLILLMTSLMAKSAKKNVPLTNQLNKFLKDGNKWEVHVLKDKIPNAFVIMGKNVFITTALEKILTEREVMSIMLHEIYHLKNNDVLKTVIGKHSFGGILLGAVGILGGGVAFLISFLLYMMYGWVFTTVMMNRMLGRKQETNADNYAVKYGYADELVTSLNKLEKVFNKLKAKMNKGKECGKLCKLGEKIGAILDEHPPLKKRTEQILRKKETWAAGMNKSFTGMKQFLFKQFGVKNPQK